MYTQSNCRRPGGALNWIDGPPPIRFHRGGRRCDWKCHDTPGENKPGFSVHHGRRRFAAARVACKASAPSPPGLGSVALLAQGYTWLPVLADGLAACGIGGDRPRGPGRASQIPERSLAHWRPAPAPLCCPSKCAARRGCQSGPRSGSSRHLPAGAAPARRTLPT